jgi:nucleoid-associated protein Lsr2
MHITIDSRDPLDQALRVVGALFGVSLTVEPNADAVAAASGSSNGGQRKRGVRRRAKAAKTTQRSGRRAVAAPADQSVVRTWAREQGLQVSDRGRVPNAILEAYQQRGR